jgi:hypothetical protein
MPAKSEAQRRLFAIAEHHPGKLYARNKALASLPRTTLHEFAAKKRLYAKKEKSHG